MVSEEEQLDRSGHEAGLKVDTLIDGPADHEYRSKAALRSLFSPKEKGR